MPTGQEVSGEEVGSTYSRPSIKWGALPVIESCPRTIVQRLRGSNVGHGRIVKL